MITQREILAVLDAGPANLQFSLYLASPTALNRMAGGTHGRPPSAQIIPANEHAPMAWQTRRIVSPPPRRMSRDKGIRHGHIAQR